MCDFYSETIIMISRERLTGEFLRNTWKTQRRFAIADQKALEKILIVGTRDNIDQKNIFLGSSYSI